MCVGGSVGGGVWIDHAFQMMRWKVIQPLTGLCLDWNEAMLWG